MLVQQYAVAAVDRKQAAIPPPRWTSPLPMLGDSIFAGRASTAAYQSLKEIVGLFMAVQPAIPFCEPFTLAILKCENLAWFKLVLDILAPDTRQIQRASVGIHAHCHDYLLHSLRGQFILHFRIMIPSNTLPSTGSMSCHRDLSRGCK